MYRDTSLHHFSRQFGPVCFTILFLLFFISGCSSHRPDYGTPQTAKKGTQKPYVINGKKYYPIPSAEGFEEKGKASWYGKDFHGRKTSNGEIYNMHASTAAHKVLPMNTVLLVQNRDNGRETVVRVNDRGPFVRGRIIDLSYKAAQEIGMVGPGVANVKITALGEFRMDRNGNPVVEHKNFDRGNFYVQLGAFLNEKNAARLEQKFIKSGHQMKRVSFNTSKGTFHRVWVYVGTSLAEARRAEAKLRNLGYTDAFVIAN